MAPNALLVPHFRDIARNIMTEPTSKTVRKTGDPKLDRKQVSLMHVFRAARLQKDATADKSKAADGSRAITERSKERRMGTDEATLRRHLTADLASLMNTINLDAVVDLSDVPYVAKSVANFGFGDMSDANDSLFARQQISNLIRETLIQHEPRLIPETIEITVVVDDEDKDQRMSFDITAEMVATPVDIPLSFVAEVDMGAGKLQMTQLRVQT